MYATDFKFMSKADGLMISAIRWGTPATAKAAVLIAHGMAEHFARYARFSEALTGAGYLVYALDHRGHGTSVPPGEAPGSFGEAGWDGLVDDVITLMGIIQEENPGLPLILFGHSMGSFAAQQVAIKASDMLDALVLSGSAAQDKLMEARLTEAAEAEEGNVLESMTPEGARTPFDWLSRDEAEVDAYIADPLCGFALDEAAMMSMATSGFAAAAPEAVAKIRKDLPVLSIAGTDDPVNGQMEYLKVLEARWRQAGVARFDTQYYEGARHELLNETNRDEVTAGLLSWLDDVVG